LLLLSQQLTWEELFEEMDRENRSFDGLEGVDSVVVEVTGRPCSPGTPGWPGPGTGRGVELV
jgi:hypothetical protein